MAMRFYVFINLCLQAMIAGVLVVMSTCVSGSATNECNFCCIKIN